MVLFYHFGPHIVRDGNSAFTFLTWIPSFWLEGVDLFFVLSGFLISGILVNARESPRYFKTFYARRLFRIFPLYYVVLMAYGLTIVVVHVDTSQRLFENPLPFWSYAFYLQNFVMASTNSYGPIWLAGTWTLAVEEQFYLTLPMLIRRIGDRGLFQLAVFGLAAAPALRAANHLLKWFPGLTNILLLPMRVDSFAVGILVMLLLRHRRDWLVMYRRQIAWGTLTLFIAWSVYHYLPNPEAVRMSFINFTVTAAVFGGILVCVLIFPMSLPGRFLSTPPMRNLGNMAYSTYLFHPILLWLAFRVLLHKDPLLVGASDLPPLAFAGVATFAMAWLSWSQFESRLLRIGHRYRY